METEHEEPNRASEVVVKAARPLSGPRQKAHWPCTMPLQPDCVAAWLGNQCGKFEVLLLLQSSDFLRKQTTDCGQIDAVDISFARDWIGLVLSTHRATQPARSQW